MNYTGLIVGMIDEYRSEDNNNNNINNNISKEIIIKRERERIKSALMENDEERMGFWIDK